MVDSNKHLLSVEDLSVEFATEKGRVRAVDGISFHIDRGETVGIVGESGCGKSVTSLAVLGLIPSPPGKIVSGRILLEEVELRNLHERDYRKLRGKDVSMIFQEPMTALNPVLKVGTQMTDVIRRHQKLGRSAARRKAIEMLEIVDIPAPVRRFEDYPHQLSGGMRQRIMIAMALSCGPKLLLADEPTTALDVTTQAQVMNEMQRLQDKFGMAVALVTHDLGVVAQSCKRVIVMYCGKIVEEGPVSSIFKTPRHPYTYGLLASVPVIRSNKLSELPTIKGMVPDLSNLPPGCRFADRCPNARDKCRIEQPPLDREHGLSAVACFYPVSQSGAIS